MYMYMFVSEHTLVCVPLPLPEYTRHQPSAARSLTTRTHTHLNSLLTSTFFAPTLHISRRSTPHSLWQMFNEESLEGGVQVTVLIAKDLRRLGQRLLPRLLVCVEFLDVLKKL